MRFFRTIPFLFCAGFLASVRPAAAQALIAKEHYSFQSDATTVQDDLENGPWMFLTQIAGANPSSTYTLTVPGSSPAAIGNPGGSSGGTELLYSQTLFPTQSALDAAYPDGNYTLAVDAASTTVPVAGAFPNVPTVTATAMPLPMVVATEPGATWTNGVLVWDYTQNLTLTASFPGIFSPGSSLLQISVVGIPYVAETTPVFANSGTGFATNAPDFTSNQVTVSFTGLGAGPNIGHSNQTLTPPNPYPAFLEVIITAANWSGYGTNSLTGGLLAAGHAAVTTFFIATGGSYTGRPPRLTAQPQPVAAAVGQTVTFTVGADGDPAPTYQWYHGSTPISGAHSATLNYTVQASDDSTYVYAAASNSIGFVRSAFATIRAYNGPPAFVVQPSNQSLQVGQTAHFASGVNSTGNTTYQWYFNGQPLAGATASLLTLTNIQYNEAGTYYAVATDPGGSSTSASATLTVNAPPSNSTTTAPFFYSPPNSQLLPAGITTVFTVNVGNGVTAAFQWYFNNVAIPGATGSLLLVPSVTAANVGSYTCTATNSYGTTTSSAAKLTLFSGPALTNPGHLVNLSVLSTASGTGTPFTIGFVVGGPNTQGNENLLMRASGPALAVPPFNLTGTLADPNIALYSGTSVLASNDNWGSPAANQASVTAADAATGAFTLSNPSSLDAAMTQNLAAGAYSLQITGNNGGSGTTLGEIYDNTPASSQTLTSRRLINVSCLNTVAAKGVLTAGFVVGGNSARTLLLRGIGPALRDFGYTTEMADPQLTLFGTISGQTAQLGSNSGWNGEPAISMAENLVNAFSVADPSSHDAMMLEYLQPGAYSVQLTSASGAPGSALIEVYEVP